MVYKEMQKKIQYYSNSNRNTSRSNNIQRTKLKANEYIKSLLLKQNDLKAKVK